MAKKLDLSFDEAVIIKSDRILHGGAFADFSDDLILTNKRIIYIKKGLFGNTKSVINYPLDSIKVYNNQAQAIVGKIGDGWPALEIYFHDSQETFGFQRKKDILLWVEKINELITGEKTTVPETNARLVIPGSEYLAKTIKGTIETYKEAFGMKKRKEYVSCYCKGCGAPVSGVKGESKRCPYCDTFTTF